MAINSIRATAKPENVADLEAAVSELFAELNEIQPAGLKYASTKTGEDTYLILLDVADGTDNPLPGIGSFLKFQAGLTRWLAGPPTVEQLTVIGSYNLF